MAKQYEEWSTEQLYNALAKSQAEHAWFPGDIADKVRHELALKTEIVRRYFATESTSVGPHFCNPVCNDSHTNEIDRAGADAECCVLPDHFDKCPDPDRTIEHVVAHLVGKRLADKARQNLADA